MTASPLGIEDQLWLEYLDALDEANQAEIKSYRDTWDKSEEHIAEEILVYNSLPWWRKLFASQPFNSYPYKFPLDAFIMTASLEGFLTWKAKGKKL